MCVNGGTHQSVPAFIVIGVFETLCVHSLSMQGKNNEMVQAQTKFQTDLGRQTVL